MNHIHVDHEGFLSWSWQARGVLRRAQRAGAMINLPTGEHTTIDIGTALTRKGAERKARRALRRWT